MVASKRQLNIPSDVASKHSIVEEDVLRNGAGAKGLKDGLWEIGTRGMDELITARRELKGSGGKVDPGNVMPLFLSVVSLRPFQSSSAFLLSP
jgi:NADH dehydrogenase [ubiquinone] 1 alpha subcomplex assembly factor 6